MLISVLVLGALWLVLTRHGPFSSDVMGDVWIYSQYHDMMHLEGLFPYRDFPFEYPPGALIPIVLNGGDADRLSFLMLGCAIVAQLAAWRISGPRAGWAMALLPVLGGSLLRLHFDLLPTAMALVGLWLVVCPPPRRGMVELGFAVLALGTMTKLWPAAIAVLAIAWLAGRGEVARAARGAGVFVGLCLAIALPFVATGGFPSTMVDFHLKRPVQIESTPATVVEVVGGSYVTGNPVRQDEFKSNGLDGGVADLVALLASAVMVGVGVWLTWTVARRPSQDAMLLAALAVTLAFVGLGKVLSPQYLCWLLPLAALVLARGYRAAPALVVLATVLTQLWFPRHYFDVVYQHAGWVALVGVRNVLLLAALAATARALARSPRLVAAAPRSG